MSGPVVFSSSHLNSASLVTHTLHVGTVLEEAETLDDRLKSFWDFGVNFTEGLVHDEFGESVTFMNGRYEVALPWKKYTTRQLQFELEATLWVITSAPTR